MRVGNRTEHDWRGSLASLLTLLAIACVLLGVLPTYVIPALDRAVEPLAGASATSALVQPFFTATESNQQLPTAFLQDFHNLGAQSGAGVLPGRGLVILLRGSAQNPVVFAMSPSYSLAALAILLLVAWFLVGRLTRRRSVAKGEVWAGGIPKLLPEMTYTATGFSNPVRVVFQAIFRPNIVEDTRQTVAVHFRTAIRRRRDETHLVERLFLCPVGAGDELLGSALRRNASRPPECVRRLRGRFPDSDSLSLSAHLSAGCISTGNPIPAIGHCRFSPFAVLSD